METKTKGPLWNTEVMSLILRAEDTDQQRATKALEMLREVGAEVGLALDANSVFGHLALWGVRCETSTIMRSTSTVEFGAPSLPELWRLLGVPGSVDGTVLEAAYLALKEPILRDAEWWHHLLGLKYGLTAVQFWGAIQGDDATSPYAAGVFVLFPEIDSRPLLKIEIDDGGWLHMDGDLLFVRYIVATRLIGIEAAALISRESESDSDTVV